MVDETAHECDEATNIHIAQTDSWWHPDFALRVGAAVLDGIESPSIREFRLGRRVREIDDMKASPHFR